MVMIELLFEAQCDIDEEHAIGIISQLNTENCASMRKSRKQLDFDYGTRESLLNAYSTTDPAIFYNFSKKGNQIWHLSYT